MPKVSVNICCYNSERFIAETIESVLAQTYKDWELVIVNDGSTDSTEQIIRAYINQGWPITYHCQANAGLAAARNQALRLSKGEYIAFLDHDDLWLPEKLEQQVDILDADPAIALVYSDCYLVDFKGELLGRVFDKVRPHRGRVLAELFTENFISCPTVLIRKQVLEKVGLFRPELCISEEYELFLRIAELYQVDFVDAPLAKYRVHETSLSRNFELGLQEHIMVAEECLERCPYLKRALGSKAKRKLTNLHYNLGRIWFSEIKLKEARKQFAQSITWYPYQTKPYLFYGLTLVLTLLPNEWAGHVMGWLRIIKRSGLRLKERV